MRVYEESEKNKRRKKRRKIQKKTLLRVLYSKPSMSSAIREVSNDPGEAKHTFRRCKSQVRNEREKRRYNEIISPSWLSLGRLSAEDIVEPLS